MGGATLTSRPRLRVLAAALVATALAACGSTINRPVRVASDAGGATGGAARSAEVATGTGDAPTGTDGAASAGVGGTGGASGGPAAGTGGATATTAAAAASGPVKTGPMEIGFMISATSNAAAFGASLPETVPQRAIYQALVDKVNKAGGIHGRKVVPVFQTTDSATNTWDADLAAACANFTEDHHVEAVLGRIQGLFDSMESCLGKRQIPHLVGAFESFDQTYLAQYPYLFDQTTTSIEQRTRLKVDWGIATGFLTPADKIGIVFAGCPQMNRSWQQDALPYFKSKGLDVASVFATGCPHGANDATTEVGKVGNLVLQFRTAKVNKILFHTDDTAGLFVIANAGEAQGYRPQYLVTSIANTAVTGSQIPAAQRPNVYGLGWAPASDVLKAQWPALNPAAQRCLGDMRAAGLAPSTPLDHVNAYLACDAMYLFLEAADVTGGRVDGPSIARAIEGMGTRHVSPLTLDGASSYGPGRHTGVAYAYPYKWDGGCACYRYAGTKVRIP